MNELTIRKHYFADGTLTTAYKTTWTDVDNHAIIMEGIDAIDMLLRTIGIIEVACFKTGEHAGEALIWNLNVTEDNRRKGCGTKLLTEAIDIAREAGCTDAFLEWDERDSPQWVHDWYERQGFEDSSFGGKGYARMTLELTNKTE